MRAACRHDESNLLALPDTLQLRRLIENATGKNIAFFASDCDPHGFCAPTGNPRSAIVDDDLKIVRMIRQEETRKFWISSPMHKIRDYRGRREACRFEGNGDTDRRGAFRAAMGHAPGSVNSWPASHT